MFTEDGRVIIMANTIGGNNPYVSSYNRTNSSALRTQQAIATGSMHSSAAYGASESAIVARMTSNIGATSQSIQNTQNLSAMVKTASGATQNTISALTVIQQHLIDAANDSNGSLDRQAIQENINQLVGQINENAYVEYNGQRLIDGTRDSLTLAGIDGYENFQMGNLRSTALGLTDAEGNVAIDVSTPEAANNSLAIVNDALDTAGNTLSSLDFMEDFVNEGISLNRALDEATTQGAQLQRMEYQEANYVTMEENMMAARSTIDDSNIAEQISQLHNEQTQEQLSLFAIRMFNQNRENILGLLQP